MKLIYVTIILPIWLFNPFSACVSTAQQANKESYDVMCATWDCLENNKNNDANIKGLFRKYTPNKTGKGAQQMFWNWELLLSDGYTVPVNPTDQSINYKAFEGHKVSIKGNIFYGVIIGNIGEQNATGFRIDAVEITPEVH